MIGELSLDGSVRHVRGVLPMAALAREQGFQRIFTPPGDAAEAALIPDLEVFPVDSLAALVAHLSGAGADPTPAARRPPKTSKCSSRPISARSKARSTSSAPWKWPPPAGTMC